MFYFVRILCKGNFGEEYRKYKQKWQKRNVFDLANHGENFPKLEISTSAQACARHPSRVPMLPIKEVTEFKGVRTPPLHIIIILLSVRTLGS